MWLENSIPDDDRDALDFELAGDSSSSSSSSCDCDAQQQAVDAAQANADALQATADELQAALADADAAVAAAQQALDASELALQAAEEAADADLATATQANAEMSPQQQAWSSALAALSDAQTAADGSVDAAQGSISAFVAAVQELSGATPSNIAALVQTAASLGEDAEQASAALDTAEATLDGAIAACTAAASSFNAAVASASTELDNLADAADAAAAAYDGYAALGEQLQQASQQDMEAAISANDAEAAVDFANGEVQRDEDALAQCAAGDCDAAPVPPPQPPDCDALEQARDAAQARANGAQADIEILSDQYGSTERIDDANRQAKGIARNGFAEAFHEMADSLADVNAAAGTFAKATMEVRDAEADLDINIAKLVLLSGEAEFDWAEILQTIGETAKTANELPALLEEEKKAATDFKGAAGDAANVGIGTFLGAWSEIEAKFDADLSGLVARLAAEKRVSAAEGRYYRANAAFQAASLAYEKCLAQRTAH